MVVTINKSTASGVIIAPPSKSYAHRLLICAALSNQECTVRNIVLSKDILATISCLETLGYCIKVNNNIVKIIPTKNKLDETLIFNCDESGSTLRFMIPIALTTGKKLIFKGSKRLIERGISSYLDIFNSCNINAVIDENSITLNGRLVPGNYKIEGNISSQFISGMLFALPLLNDDSSLEVITNIESKNYIDITLDVLGKCNINVKESKNVYSIKKGKYKCSEFIVEGDYSNSAFLDALNYLEGSVLIKDLNQDSCQGDKVYKKYFDLLNNQYAKIDISDCIDLGPILFCFAALKHGGHFINTKRLRIKECDRISCLKKEFDKFGIELNDLENEVIIKNNNIHKPSDALVGHNDHRIIMALSIMLTVYGGVIKEVEAVCKSYPNFFNDLLNLNIDCKIDNE